MTNTATTDGDSVHLRELDWLMLVTVTLASLGLMMAVSVLGSRVEIGPLVAVKQHSWKLMFGLLAFLIAAAVPIRLLHRVALPMFLVATAACLLPHLMRGVKGANRWVYLGDYQFQPVEPARFFMVLAVALLLARAGTGVSTFRRGFYPAMGCAALLGAVLMTQPDNGNALIVLAIASVLAVIAGVRMVHFLPFVLVGGALFAAAALQHDYVRSRIDQFLTPAPSSQVGLSLNDLIYFIFIFPKVTS